MFVSPLGEDLKTWVRAPVGSQGPWISRIIIEKYGNTIFLPLKLYSKVGTDRPFYRTRKTERRYSLRLILLVALMLADILLLDCKKSKLRDWRLWNVSNKPFRGRHTKMTNLQSVLIWELSIYNASASMKAERRGVSAHQAFWLTIFLYHSQVDELGAEGWHHSQGRVLLQSSAFWWPNLLSVLSTSLPSLSPVHFIVCPWKSPVINKRSFRRWWKSSYIIFL